MDAKAEQERLFPRKLLREYDDMQTPRNVWVQIPPTLPTICLDLRASITGASDPWGSRVLSEVVAMLEARAAQWDHGRTDEMDVAVLRMVREAAWMGKSELAARNARGVVYLDGEG